MIAFGGAGPDAAAAIRSQSAPAGWRTVDVTRTNSNTRVITNVIEVTVPRNVFVDEYRTNPVQQTLTNVIDVYLTNWSTRWVTNTVAVKAVRTNVLDVFATNWSVKLLTNTLTVDLIRTNILDRYRTNWTAVTLTNLVTFSATNFETVLVTKTNWVRQLVTNLVEVNAPVAAEATVAVTRPENPPAGSTTDALMLEAVRTSRPADSAQVEVRFKVRLANDVAAQLQVLQCRVEREDGAVLFFGEGQEFKRALPPGRYRVEIKARRDADSPVLTLHSSLDLTRDGIVRR
ncbi:MAG TPA: hypothetical protein VI454_13435 [Verrucomicrobiae bacterium]